MKKYRKYLLLGCVICLGFVLLQSQTWQNKNGEETTTSSVAVESKKMYKNFLLDTVLHSKENGDIHYNVYIPSSYDGSEAYAMYVTLPGYQGLYFQGVGENVKTEEFGFVAQDYNKKMIVLAPQLEDWGETSANQTIELVEYFLSHYNIDKAKVYANGYSGGGETMSLVMGKRPDLFTRYLHASSKWDGDLNVLVESETPIYIVIGENDEYYGSQSSKDTYRQIVELYSQKGLSQERIDTLVTLDIKTSDYFTSQGIDNQHGYGGHLFCHDSQIMNWLFHE